MLEWVHISGGIYVSFLEDCDRVLYQHILLYLNLTPTPPPLKKGYFIQMAACKRNVFQQWLTRNEDFFNFLGLDVIIAIIKTFFA